MTKLGSEGPYVVMYHDDTMGENITRTMTLVEITTMLTKLAGRLDPWQGEPLQHVALTIDTEETS